MLRKPGFTLLELLLTTVLFVVIAGIATATFSSTARFQFLSKEDQGTSTQLQAAEQTIGGAIGRAYATDASHQPVILADSATSNPNHILILYSQKVQPDGSVTGAATDNNWEVYCIETDGTAKRLVRFTLTSSATYNGGVSSATCSASGIQSLFSGVVGTGIVGPDYLTENQVDVQALHFWPMTYAGANPDPAAIRLEIAAVVDLTNGGAEQRANDVTNPANPIVVRSIANRPDPSIDRIP